jgi:signal recognition particle subunit SRP54
MLPGAAKNRELLNQVNDKDLDRAEAIVRSMTPEERRNPKIINGSRRLRVANGSGVSVGEVSQLVKNFFEGQKQMKAMFSGGMPGMPALPGMGGARRTAKSARGKKRNKRAARGGAGSGGGQPRPALPGGAAGAGAPGGPGALGPAALGGGAAGLGSGAAGLGGGGLGGLPEGFDLSEGLAGLPDLPKPPGNVPAAFRGGTGKRPKKK